jgi:hypothetical protein
MQSSTIALHHLDVDARGELVTHSNNGFDNGAYSMMKYGDELSTRVFASRMASLLVDNYPDLIETETPPVFATAYKYVPPACFYLSRYCLAEINTHRSELDLEPGEELHVYKNRVTSTDYAASSVEDRDRELNGIGFSLMGDITDRTVVVLDDIRITGSAERAMLETLQPGNPCAVVLGYIAMLNPDVAETRPSIESDINGFTVRKLVDVSSIIERSMINGTGFDLNIRTLKKILGSSVDELICFLDAASTSIVRCIYDGAINTGPEFINSYEESIGIVRQVVINREKPNEQ